MHVAMKYLSKEHFRLKYFLIATALIKSRGFHIVKAIEKVFLTR